MTAAERAERAARADVLCQQAYASVGAPEVGVALVAVGGYGREELFYSGAYRVFEDPADLLAHLDEVGVRRAR